MSRGYANFFPSTLLSAHAVSGTITVSGSPIRCDRFSGITFVCSWTGSPTGTLSVQASLDNITYFDIGASVSQQPGAGSATATMINNVGIVAPWVTIFYTNSAGTGALTVQGYAREMGV